MFYLGYEYAYGGAFTYIALAPSAASAGGMALSSQEPYGNPTSYDFYYRLDKKAAVSEDEKTVYFVYLPEARYGTSHKIEDNNKKMYNPTTKIICMLSTTEGFTADEFKNSISDERVDKDKFNPSQFTDYYYSTDQWTYNTAKPVVCINGVGPQHGLSFSIMKVDNLEEAYNNYSDGFKISIGDTKTSLKEEKTMSFDMTVRCSMTYDYNCYYMRSYGSPINTEGIIFFLFKTVEYLDITGKEKRYYEKLKDFKTQKYRDMDGNIHEDGDKLKVSDLEFPDGNSYTTITDTWGDPNGAQLQPVFDNITLNKYTCGNYGASNTCVGKEEDKYWRKNSESGSCDGGCGAEIEKTDRFSLSVGEMEEGVNITRMVKGEYAYMQSKYDDEGKCIGVTYLTVSDKINSDVIVMQQEIEQAMIDSESNREYSAGDFGWIQNFSQKVDGRSKGKLAGFSSDDSKEIWTDACVAIDKACKDKFYKTDYISIDDEDDLTTYKIGKYALSGEDIYVLLRNFLDDGSYAYYFQNKNFNTNDREAILRIKDDSSSPTTASLIYTIWRDYAPDCDASDPFFIKDMDAWAGGDIPYISKTSSGKAKERQELKKALEVLLESEVCRSAQSKWFAYKVNDCLEAANQIFISQKTKTDRGMLIYLAAMPFCLSGTMYKDYNMGDTEMLEVYNINYDYDIVYDLVFYDNGNSTDLNANLKAFNARFAMLSGQAKDQNYMHDLYEILTEELEYEANSNPSK